MAALTKAAGSNFVAAMPTNNGLKFDYNQIEQEHRKTTIAAAVEINAHTSRMQESALTIGKRLLAIKDVLPHGQFEDWVATEFTFSIRTAQNFMNVFERFGHQPKAIDLFSPSGLYLLAAPSTPPEVVKEAVKEARKVVRATGEKMGREAVKNIVKPAQKTTEIHEKSATVALLKPAEIDADFIVIDQPKRAPMQWWNNLSAAEQEARIVRIWEMEGKP